MTATPATAARQILAAKAAREAAARIPVRLAYTTRTGDVKAPARPELEQPAYEDDDAHCFVCGRHTDHAGEHDTLVEFGLAYYRGSDVLWLPVRWSEEGDSLLAAARAKDDAEHAVWLAQLEANIAAAR